MIRLFNDYNSPEFEQVKAIRKTVFIDEQHAETSAVFDEKDKDASTVFALVTDSDSPVATGRLTLEGECFKIGRVAVLQSERGKGTGKRLIEFLCKEAQKNGRPVIVNAQLHAVSFYEKLGFKPTGEDEIIEIGITHLPMRKD